MRSKASATAAVVLLVLAIQSAGLAAVPPGLKVITAPPQTDVMVSYPFNPVIEETLTVNGAPAGTSLPLTGGALAGKDYGRGGEQTFYVRFISGGSAGPEGAWSTIIGHTDNDLTIGNAALAALVGNGDSFRIYKHRKVRDVFPPSMLGTSYLNGTQVLLFNNAANQQFKLGQIFTYIQAADQFIGAGIADTMTLEPDSAFILRNGSTTKTLTLFLAGTTPDYKVKRVLPAGAVKDILIGPGYPVDLPVLLTGLGTVPGRQVVVFDNSGVGQFKVGQIASWVGTVWAPAPPDIDGAGGFIFRQNGDAGGVVSAVKPY